MYKLASQAMSLLYVHLHTSPLLVGSHIRSPLGCCLARACDDRAVSMGAGGWRGPQAVTVSGCAAIELR